MFLKLQLLAAFVRNFIGNKKLKNAIKKNLTIGCQMRAKLPMIVTEKPKSFNFILRYFYASSFVTQITQQVEQIRARFIGTNYLLILKTQ